MTFPYPPDPGEHVLETSSAPTTLVQRDKLDLSSLIPPKGEMESSFSWTCPFKSPTSSTLCFGEPTLGKLNKETDFYMTKHVPKPSSGANRVSASHSSLVTKNGELFMGRTSYMIFPSHGSTSRRLTGETNSSSTTLHMDTCLWKLTGEANSTTPHVDILWLTGKVMKHTLLDTRPQKLIGVVMTLMDLITLHPCPSSILMTYWGEPSSYLWIHPCPSSILMTYWGEPSSYLWIHPCPSSILMTYCGEPSSYLWMRMGRERGLGSLSTTCLKRRSAQIQAQD